MTDDKVVVMPGVDEIPPPSFPLGEWGEPVYREWAEKLIRQGVFTDLVKADVEQLAIASHTMAAQAAQNKTVSTKALESRTSALRRLGKVVNEQSAAPSQPKANSFQKLGFARRARISATG